MRLGRAVTGNAYVAFQRYERRQRCDSARGRGRSRAIEVAAHEPQNFRRGIADVASPNAIVLHDNSLSELFSDGLRDEARDCVCPAAGSIGNDQAYWPRPIALCPRDA